MHLRGPMNVSQLAVYQLPSEMHTLQKRNTVPFYNRLRALRQRDIFRSIGTSSERRHSSSTHEAQILDKRTYNMTKSSNFLKFTSVQSSEEQHQIIATPTPTSNANMSHKRDNVQAVADWSRVAYYTSAAPAQATGFSFLANLGDPQKSGTFD